MTKEQYKLIRLSEELSEVQKEVSKALRFGMNDINPVTKVKNKNAIKEEFFDVVFMMVELGYFKDCYEIGGFVLDCDLGERKEKYEKWYKYSKEKGVVNE